MKLKKYVFFWGLALMLFSCDSNWGEYGGYKMDYDSKLEYYIVLDKADTTCVNSLGYSHKGSQITFYRDSCTTDTICLAKGAIVIETFVNEVVFDSSFVLVDQKPLDKICECNVDCLREKYNREAYTATSFDFCKEGLEKSSIHDYWIIKKKTDEIYGPLSRVDYLKKREVFGVPDELKLDVEQ